MPSLLKCTITYNGKQKTALEILNENFSKEYIIEAAVLNSADYGVPQTRERAIIKMYRKGLYWPWPCKSNHRITVREAIGFLPSLESGQKSQIKWHFARVHTPNNVLWMKHTPTGHSAFENTVYYPQKSYVTIRNDCIASQRNVHPGRLLPDGTYSDARVLTPLELMLLDSLPMDWNIPDDTPELLIRQVIGESIPPKMLLAIVKEIKR